MKIDVVVPTIGESVTEATMGTWLKDEGTFVEEDDIICEIESEKATVEITAEKSGVLHQKAESGDTLTIGALIAEIEVGKNGSKVTPTDSGKSELKEKTTAEKSPAEDKKEIHSKISPVAANMLEKSGIKPEKIQGSGVGGRVTKADVLKELNKEPANDEAKKRSSAQPLKKIAGSDRTERHEKMTTLRKTIARRLLEAKNGTAMLTTFNEVDLLKVKQLREEYKESFKEKYGVGLGFMSLFTKACSIALLELPQVNAMIEGEEIVYHDYTDIGIAVSTEKGLVVPVIRDVHLLSLAEIEMEVARIATRARDGKLTVDEMTGGTFSITNGGVFGSMMATPIINAPQSAILGMHAIKDRPVVVDGQIVIRPMMYVALSYDHRIIDGKESVTFLKRVKELLEDPIRMVLEV